MLLKEIFIHKTYTSNKKSIGFFVIFITALLLCFGIGTSYGMGSIKKIFDSGGSNKKTTIIRGIVYDKSKPIGQRNIAGAKVDLLNSSNSLLKEVSSNAQGYYEISLKLSSGSYKVVCKANNFKQAEISSNISKGRTYNTGFDFSLELIDNIPPVIKLTPVQSPTNKEVRLEYTLSDNVTPANEIQVTGDQSPYTKDGTYKVILIAKDKANNTSIARVNFIIDKISPTGTIKINNDAQYTNNKSGAVTLTLPAQDNAGISAVSQMKFSNNNVTWSVPEKYVNTKTYTLPLGDGEKTVYVKFSDNAENWSQVYSDRITLDTTAPILSVDPVSSFTKENVTLSYTVVDNFTPIEKIVVSGDKSPYIDEGKHKVTLTAIDLAGNSASATVEFTIDKSAPVVIITSPQNEAIVEDSPVQLQGTVDGVSFSESRTLNSGENTLTKTATDSAGNPASALITVYLYLGELIGPEGGQVSSADGKVKVIIPAGALTEPTRIRISKIDKDTMQDALPSGRSLLSIVECKPYGLVFKQPDNPDEFVKLVYSLEQAEVPGTPVELGFFDAVQDKIIPTGQTTTVSVDGYTVKFSLMHFSTYACLDYVSKQGAPIGAGVQIPLPDLLTGSFSHAIPITVPPGRKGMQPQIGLSYRSSNPNSWVGLGFSLNSGYIVRSTRLGPPTYDDKQDTFYFITEAGTTELVHLIDNLYQAKVESGFTRFFKETDDTWKVVTKDGAVLRFGQTTDSKEASPQGTFSWYITKAVDTNGNYIEYNYTKDQGKAYLSRIDYTGNETGISPTNSVEFNLEPREDISSSYISTARIATTRRLKEIEAKVKGELVWRYELEYDYSPDSNRSLLKSVKQSGSDGKSLPVQRFGYQKSK